MRIISGEFRGRPIRTGSGPGYRPATGKVREAVFSMLEARGLGWEEVRILDLFAGSGSLGLEGLSRGAVEAWFVERNKRAAQIIRENIRLLGLGPERTRVVGEDLFPFLERGAESPFQVVFIDPPYGKDLLMPALQAVLAHGWLAEHGVLLAETEAELELAAPEQLHQLVEKQYGQTRIHIWRKK